MISASELACTLPFRDETSRFVFLFPPLLVSPENPNSALLSPLAAGGIMYDILSRITVAVVSQSNSGWGFFVF